MFFFFFFHLFMLAAFYRLTSFLHGIFISFLSSLHIVEMIMNGKNENAITLWQCFRWCTVDQELHVICLYVASVFYFISLLFKFSSVIDISLLRPACSCFSVYAAWSRAIALYTALRPACIKKCIIMKPCKMKCDLPHVAAQIAQARLFERASHHHLFIPPCIL